MDSETKSFFDGYRAAFPQGAAAIAAFYAEPCVTSREGQVRVNPTRADTTALFSVVDEQYRARGYTHADYVELGFEQLGANSAIATLRWTYKNAAGDPILV